MTVIETGTKTRDWYLVVPFTWLGVCPPLLLFTPQVSSGIAAIPAPAAAATLDVAIRRSLAQGFQR